MDGGDGRNVGFLAVMVVECCSECGEESAWCFLNCDFCDFCDGL